MPYTRVKHAIYKQNDDYTLLYRTSFEEQLLEAESSAAETHSALATRSSGCRRHKTPATRPTENTSPVAHLLHSKLKLSAERKTDIISMPKFLPMVDEEFIKAPLGNNLSLIHI